MAQKLGIKPDGTIAVINDPGNYRKLLGRIGGTVKFSDTVTNNAAFIHLFVTTRAELEKRLQQFRQKLADSGVLWVSWPKKTAGVQTDVSEDVIRAVALPLHLVDVKVCAVDETWSGLKLVIRREHRKGGSKK